MYILQEAPSIAGIPQNIKSLNKGSKIRFSAVLQTCGDVNRNGRTYSKDVINESIKIIEPRIKGRDFVGELDHPTNSSAQRQVQVLYKEASHLIVELGWDGNKLIGVLETLSTRNGKDLRALIAEDGVAVGFSYRGMGDLVQLQERHNGRPVFKVTGPLTTISWDSVSFPSHAGAKVISFSEMSTLNEAYNPNTKNNITKPVKLTQDVQKVIYESFTPDSIIKEENGMICTKSGVCYLPNDFDYLVNKRMKNLESKFRK